MKHVKILLLKDNITIASVADIQCPNQDTSELLDEYCKDFEDTLISIREYRKKNSWDKDLTGLNQIALKQNNPQVYSLTLCYKVHGIDSNLSFSIACEKMSRIVDIRLKQLVA